MPIRTRGQWEQFKLFKDMGLQKGAQDRGTQIVGDLHRLPVRRGERRRREERRVEYDGSGEPAEGEGGHYHAEGAHHFAERGGGEEEEEQVLWLSR